ncbi:hypothetical protein [Streptomyces sp. NRRL F-5650]|uniref:hypothetical protein n=1 Tax=Streptomyces sp. NRRL F-5650 TaxID=1463868 RepID=UPI00099E0C83|nr:hypothetical protein [Streptomyces sp. NRRL F-5650]
MRAEQEFPAAQDVDVGLRGLAEVALDLADRPGGGGAQAGGRDAQTGEHHAHGPAPGEQSDRERVAGGVVGGGEELVERAGRRARWEGVQRVDEVGDHREVQHPGHRGRRGA